MVVLQEADQQLRVQKRTKMMIKMLLMQVRLEDLCKEKRSPALALQFTANPFLHTLPSVINEGMAMESEPSVARVARN